MLQWVKNFSVYKKSGTRWSSLMIFVYQTLMASQMAVGANTVRPFRLQSHLRYSHNVRRNNSQHCLLLFIREKSKLSRFDIGLSRAPAPTPKFYRRKIAVLGAEGVTLVGFAHSSFLTPHSSFFFTPHTHSCSTIL